MKIILVMLASISFSGVCYAGEILKAGDVLPEDSYVFSIEEAERLKDRVIELEKLERKVEEYKKLEALYENKIDLYLENENVYKRRVSNLDQIISSLEKVNERHERHQKWDKAENYIILSSAIAGTILTFITVDYINDNAIID